MIIEAIGVNDSSNSNAVEVADGHILSTGTQESVTSNFIPVDTSTDDDTRVDFDDNSDVSLPTSGSDSTKAFEFDRFRDGGGKNAKMKGESITTTFYFTDGSSKIVIMAP